MHPHLTRLEHAFVAVFPVISTCYRIRTGKFINHNLLIRKRPLITWWSLWDKHSSRECPDR